jgi:hypothetical protein
LQQAQLRGGVAGRDSADMAGLQYGHPTTRAGQQGSRGQPGQPGADHHVVVFGARLELVGLDLIATVQPK